MSEDRDRARAEGHRRCWRYGHAVSSARMQMNSQTSVCTNLEESGSGCSGGGTVSSNEPATGRQRPGAAQHLHCTHTRKTRARTLHTHTATQRSERRARGTTHSSERSGGATDAHPGERSSDGGSSGSGDAAPARQAAPRLSTGLASDCTHPHARALTSNSARNTQKAECARL